MKRLKIFLFYSILFFTLSFTKDAYAIQYGGFGGLPANPDPNNPRSESIFIYNLEPGQFKQDGVRVLNNTTETKTYIVYSADATKSTDGGFACKQLSENKKSVGGWINFDKNEVELEPYTEETINFTILTPQDVEVGEHNGCILIQEKKDANASTQSGINLALRTGMRVAVTIPGEIVRKLSITEFYTDILGLAKTTLTMSVKNEGNVSIDSQVRIPLYTLWGKEYQVFEGQFPILRGDTSNFNIDVKKNTWGNILRSQGFVEYDSNTDAQIGVDTQSEKIKLQTSEIYVFILPEPKGLIIELSILILIFALLIWLFILVKRKIWIKKSWIDYKVVSGDDLKSLSQKFEVNWKLLARANKIKAPYIITEGEVIKRPPEPKSKKGKKAITSLSEKGTDNKDSDVKPISSIKSS